jgi:hypothetical protein
MRHDTLRMRHSQIEYWMCRILHQILISHLECKGHHGKNHHPIILTSKYMRRALFFRPRKRVRETGLAKLLLGRL